MHNFITRNANALQPLTDEQLRKNVPSIFATEPHRSVSERYGFIPTSAVLQALRKEGFMPMEAREYYRRNAKDRQFTKHMIRFGHASNRSAPKQVGDLVPQMVMVNAHDRSSTYHLWGGIMRLACLNGLLVAASAVVAPIAVRHTRNVVEDILKASFELAKQHGHIMDHVRQMQGVKLSDKQRLAFARDALELRFSDTLIEPELLLVPRREADKGADLWRTYNVVQENLVRGGLVAAAASGRRVHTRPINAINGDLHVNAGLWELAMSAINKASASSKAALKKEKVTA